MVKGLLFVILCSLQFFAQAGEKWLVRSETKDLGVTCATPRPVSDGHLWAFCDGQNSQHGELRRFDLNGDLLSQLKLPSQDRLALLNSVSAMSHWIEQGNEVLVGTQDGRVLAFNLNGELVRSKLLGEYRVNKVLKVESKELWVQSEGTKDVRVVKLDRELNVLQEIVLPHAKQESESVVAFESFYFATDAGHLLIVNKALEVTADWALTKNKELGAPLVTESTVWVGDAAGMLHHISLTTKSVWSKQYASDAIELAPIQTGEFVWLALEESGQLKMLDSEGKVKQSVKLPFTRSFLSFTSVAYRGDDLLTVASHGHFALLSARGEVLVKLNRPGKELHFGVSTFGDFLIVGESNHPMKWRLQPLHLRPTSQLDKVSLRP